MSDFDLGLSFLAAQSSGSLVVLFWYTLVFEIPRYSLGFVAIGLAPLAARLFGRFERAGELPPMPPLRVSVVIAGHNEAHSLERCVRSLREQSLSGFEIIIVSDGSSDGMAATAARLVRSGLADRALATDLRGGKSSGINLAIGAASGNIIVNVDCDCSYDRFAIENIIAYFRDPSVGAVCGDIMPRNGDDSLTARFQEIEYLFTLSVGKRIGASLDQVVCISGAFGAFRREAIDAIGAFDVGGGEDLDLTLRLRAKGWRVAFAADAVCYTDVPTKLWTLIRQRLRWERDAIWLRFRKHRRLMDPRSPTFRLSEAFHQCDFLVFNVAAALIFPFYLVWLFVQYGEFAIAILVAMQVGLFAIDVTLLAIAGQVTGRPSFARNLLYLFGYSIFAAYVMRLVRAWAYLEEWFLSGSRRDNYVPLKVRTVRKW
jgi:cellulose synthase/poly-beta-1,6-N-acetylglucosamine synthase-like glycosyltransferase